MLSRTQDLIGLPVLGGLSLILLVVVCYLAGKQAGKIAGIFGVAFIALRLFRENAVLKAQVKTDEENRKAVLRSDEIRRASRSASDRGELHNDDGFKRK